MTLEPHDPARLADFYRAVFRWPELSGQEDRIWLACGERARLGQWSHGPKECGDEGGRHVHPEGNVVEAWDVFERGEGARDGVEALT